MKVVLLAMNIWLAAGILAQQPGSEDSAAQRAPTMQQVRRADSLRAGGDYQAAERILRETLASEPSNTESRRVVENALADLLREEGRSGEARELFTRLNDSQEGMPRMRINALIGLADIDLDRGDFKTSTDEWNQALEISRREQDTGAEVAILRGLGRTWLYAGSSARAQPLLRASLELAEKDTTGDPLVLAASLAAMAEFYRFENKLALAEDAWSRALGIEQKTFGEDHPQVVYLMEDLSEVYSARGETDLASDYAQRAVAGMRKQFGDNSPATATAVANLALVEAREHTLAAAANDYEAAIQVMRNFPGPSLKIVMQRYEGVLKALHRDHEAKTLAMEAKAMTGN